MECHLRRMSPIPRAGSLNPKSLSRALLVGGTLILSAALAQGGTSVSAPLSSVDNLHGIVNVGSIPKNGGLDGKGNDYAAALLGTSVSWAGSTFTFGAAGALDAVSSATITLPAGNYAMLNLLGTAVNGNQAAQTFIVTYTDGTTSSFTQGLSDWHTPQS
jgi:hypothetical protein